MWGSYVCGRHSAGGGLWVELQTMLEVVQVYVVRWRMTFNSMKSKIMVVGKREVGTSWKIGEEIMEAVEEF